jgi:hypothetical protein
MNDIRQDMNKVNETIKSCTDTFQLAGAKRLMDAFQNKWNMDPNHDMMIAFKDLWTYKLIKLT